MSDSESDRPTSISPSLDGKKRKRKSIVPPEDEIEIDVNLPEPPSKKAKRLEKKKKAKKETDGNTNAQDPDAKGDKPETTSNGTNAPVDASSTPKRSVHGIWVGNLPFSATKESLRQFLSEHGKIAENQITRVHMPAPADKGPTAQKFKPQNKGFAYVDFTSQEVLDKALALSETLLAGRRVLIKNAKSFEGRPDKTNAEVEAAKASSKPPAKRIFVGNLDFTMTQEELHTHFSQAGEIEDVHVATFEDSGKCKGFAWVRFVELEAAEAAVRGFIFKTRRDDDNEESGDEPDENEDSRGKGAKQKEKKTRQKWFINRLHGRPLRCEFAEDAQTRYKKRFGKEGKDRVDQAGDAISEENGEAAAGSRTERDAARPPRREKHFKKRDARTVAPGQALATAQRSTAAIVAGSGKKVTFD